MILFQACEVKWEFKTWNLVRRTDPHSQSKHEPRRGPSTQPRNDPTPSRVLETHPARPSTASVDPPSEFPSVNLKLVKCRSLIHYVK